MLPELHVFWQPVKACSLTFMVIFPEQMDQVASTAFQGRGYGSETATLLETHLFSSPAIRQIALAVLIQNTPAMAFWEKRGYARGGRYVDNEGDDVYAYLLSRSTWKRDQACRPIG